MPPPLDWKQSQLQCLRLRLRLHKRPIMKNNYDGRETIAELEQAADWFRRKDT